MDGNKNEKINKIRYQVEYYLSDENMCKDKFFHDLITKDIEVMHNLKKGYFDLNVILSCNNIKKLEATLEEIQEALSTSTKVELSADKMKLRRKDNLTLPELKLLQNKRKKEKTEEENDEEAKEENMDQVILRIKTVSGETEIKWQKILDYFKKENQNLNVVYIRFNKTEGHIGVTRSISQEVEFRSDMRIENNDFKILKCEGDDLIEFFKEHGSHLEHCLAKNRKNKGSKKKQNKFELRKTVEIGGETYNDLSNIKGRCRKILTLTKDGERVNGIDHEFMKDLLKFDKKSEDKLKDFDHFTTGQLSLTTYSRTFYIVKTDGSKEEFSAFKCLEWLQNTQNKKN